MAFHGFPMPPPLKRRAAGLGAFLAASLTLALLTACGGGGSDGSTGNGAPALVAIASSDADARLLASNCFQCHGTNGTGGFDNIRGGESSEVSKYRNLAQKPANSDIMAAHAQGYTDAQIAMIVRYLQQ
jgi:cytochrome subunit of sulfide dehydrogenase